MDAKTKFWMKQCLANDEYSSDEELLEFFLKEGGLSRDEAASWVALRHEYMMNMFCTLEPDDPKGNNGVYELPTFKGYTVDMRLREFRKANIGEELEFVPFDSPEGKELLGRLKQFAVEVLMRERDE
jgi:hypothetical protein